MIAAFQSQPDLIQYERILRPFAYSLTQNLEETNDLIQDTFYRALANQDKFSEGSNIKGWLFTIMRNIFINNYRQKKTNKNNTGSLDDLFIRNNSRLVERNGAEGLLLEETINKAMEGVSKDFTGPFMMHYNGFQYDEIAEKLKLPLGTVKSRIFFAKKELQNKLKGLGITHSAVYN